MAHSLSKNWLHLVFSTTNWNPLISKDLEPRLYEIIRKEISGLGCYLDRINGMPDHLHILFLLHPSRALADVVKQLKGASAYQVNQNDWIQKKFVWQKGYGAFSVSESQLFKVRKYIDNQKEHHRKLNFKKEYEQFIKLHNLDKND